ncbi:hypothetical protein FRN05_22240 [Salmonella enterica subsp. enterica]|uniref:hypothetical protein n=1 Tax=Salmonella enterica TaxID=28901 RepID=UPI0009AF571B|nr:hypothetical protein [Salmonella enterica]EBG9558181.1 hypothetical protein [Salmonella enterica subsp. enterica serovar Enteritidis]EBW2268884.1 hypothetical protein [Salmonella enterica subsp. enterica serovar Hillingdon]ECD2968452.1 hypothetical protein [Salmonella enterica subsp. enterica]ECG2650959.1 hypothetical protein [Salmonella enterica subsp. enterica serovar Chailey]ECK7392354.1 hypothetical protein [Salmonella enterica subsp. enterica serovar Meleagridis]EDU3847334.1 hypotheti
MGCLIVSGVKFYSLAEGASYPDPHADNQYVGAYCVFPFEGKWVAQKYLRGGRGHWTDITARRFDTENEAFSFTYEYAFSPENRYKY